MKIKSNDAITHTATACCVGLIPHLACAPLAAFTAAATTGASATYLKNIGYEWSLGIALALPLISTAAWAAFRFKKSELTEKIVALSAGALSLAFISATHIPHALEVENANREELIKMWSGIPKEFRDQAMINIAKGDNCLMSVKLTVALCSQKLEKHQSLKAEDLPLCLR